MDEDKALNEIRKATYNDDPSFPVLMDQIIALATKYKEKYEEVAEGNRSASVTSLLLDAGVKVAYVSNTRKEVTLTPRGIEDEGTLLSENEHLVMVQQGKTATLIDTYQSRSYVVQSVAIKRTLAFGDPAAFHLVSDGKRKLLYLEVNEGNRYLWYLIPNKRRIHVQDNHLSIPGASLVVIPYRKIPPDVQEWLE